MLSAQVESFDAFSSTQSEHVGRIVDWDSGAKTTVNQVCFSFFLHFLISSIQSFPLGRHNFATKFEECFRVLVDDDWLG
jgi:hypothetical protein